MGGRCVVCGVEKKEGIWGKLCKHRRMYKYRYGVGKLDFTEDPPEGTRENFE